MVFGEKAHFDALLCKEVVRAEEKFDDEFDDKGTSWRDHDEDFQLDRMMDEIGELVLAIEIPYGEHDDADYRVYRLKEMRSEFIDVVNCALMGADWCTQKLEKIRKAEKEDKK